MLVVLLIDLASGAFSARPNEMAEDQDYEIETRQQNNRNLHQKV